MKISVITIVLNSCDTVADTIRSVIGQTCKDVEYIIVDGGSTDGTMKIINSFREHIAVLISEPDSGYSNAENKGLRVASGDIVGTLNPDDMFVNPTVLERIANVFIDDAMVDAVYGDVDYVSRNDSNSIIRHWVSGAFSRAKLSWGWMPPTPTLYVRRKHYEKLGGIDESYKIACDYHTSLRLFSQADFNVVYLPEVLIKMRYGGMSNKLENVLYKSYEDLRALRETGVGGIGALLWKNFSKVGQFFMR